MGMIGAQVYEFKRKLERALAIALVVRGHVLVQGVPGLGKTLLAKTLARALGGEFKRIQGTPDLMPIRPLWQSRLETPGHEC
jgi:MoxR-like ATPase